MFGCSSFSLSRETRTKTIVRARGGGCGSGSMDTANVTGDHQSGGRASPCRVCASARETQFWVLSPSQSQRHLGHQAPVSHPFPSPCTALLNPSPRLRRCTEGSFDSVVPLTGRARSVQRGCSRVASKERDGKPLPSRIPDSKQKSVFF